MPTIAVSGMNAGESPQPGPAIVRCLRAAPGFRGRIVGLLYDAMESGAYTPGLLDDVFVVPYPSSGTDALQARLEYIQGVCPLDVLIPALDAELPAYIRLAEPLAALGIRTFLPTEAQLEARSKARLAELGRRHGVPVPRQQLVTAPDQLPTAFAAFGGEVMVKGLYYEAGSAATVAEAERVAAKITARWGYPIILQEKIAGEEYDLALLGDGHGTVLGAVAIKKMALTEKGKAFGGMTISDGKLFALGRRLIAGTRWRGPLELEFVKSARDGDYHLIEINPRFPAWIYLASQVGQNLPAAVVALARGETVAPFPAGRPGTFFVRHAIDIVADLARLEELTVAGEAHAS